MINTAAVVTCGLLAGLAVFKAMLVAGRPWGGQYEALPRGLRVGSAVSIVLYALFAVVILSAAGVLALLPDGFVDVAIWVVAGYFLLGVVLNAVSRSRPERLVMTPLVALLAAGCLTLALQRS